MKILIITTVNITGLNYHRQLLPHKHLMDNYPDYEVIKAYSMDRITDEMLEAIDVVTFLRIVDTDGRSKEMIDRAKSFGCVTVLDIDDYWELRKNHEQSDNYNKINYPKQAIESISNVDYVTTTTEHFANKLREYNKNVLVFPNSIDAKEPQFIPNPIASDRIRIGWIGGVFHGDDLKMVYDGFKEVWKSINHNNFQLCLGGWNYPDKLQYVKDRLKDSPFDVQTREMFETFKRNLEIGVDVPDHLIFNPYYNNLQPYDLIEGYFTDFLKYPKDPEYQSYLRKKVAAGNEVGNNKPYKRLLAKEPNDYATLYNEIDIALVPLQENSFNSFKSQIKIIEAGWFKKAAIVSNVMPYTIDCNRSNSVLISPSKRNNGWGVAMKSLIINKERREDLAEALHETVTKKYMMDIVNKSRHEFYQTLCK